MSIRSREDVVVTLDNYNDLMKRICKLLSIYKKFDIATVRAYKSIRIKNISEKFVCVELLRLNEEKHYSYVDIIDPNAGPPGFGFGWEPSGEDIIGSEQVYDGSTWAIKVVGSIEIPYCDIAIFDDSYLKDIEAKYKTIYDDKKKKELIKSKQIELTAKEKEITAIKDALNELTT